MPDEEFLDHPDWMSSEWNGHASRLIEQAVYPEVKDSATISSAPPEAERCRDVDGVMRRLMSMQSDGIRHIFEDPLAPEGRDLAHKGWKHWRNMSHNEVLEGGDWPLGREGGLAYKRKLLLRRKDVERVVRDIELLRHAGGDAEAPVELATGARRASQQLEPQPEASELQPEKPELRPTDIGSAAKDLSQGQDEGAPVASDAPTRADDALAAKNDGANHPTISQHQAAAEVGSDDEDASKVDRAQAVEDGGQDEDVQASEGSDQVELVADEGSQDEEDAASANGDPSEAIC